MKKIFTIAILAFNMSVFGQIPTDGLIGYWPFTGNADDLSGNNYDGITEGVLLTIDRFGNPYNAYHFNGYYSQIILNNNQPIITSDEFTISAWAIMDGPGGGYELQNNLFEQRGDDASPSGAKSAIVLMPESQNLQTLFIVRSSINDSAATSIVFNPSKGYGAWHHYVGLLDLSDTLRLYIDGIEVGKTSFTQTGNFYTDIDYVDFGNHIHTGSYRGVFNGDIDDVRIYNRALNSTEIISLYQDNTVGFITEESKSVFMVYPNPATDQISVALKALGRVEIQILDASDKMILVKNETSSSFGSLLTIPVSSYKPGIYFLQVRDENGNSSSRRFVKN